MSSWQPPSSVSGHSGGGSHVEATTFSSQWITTEFWWNCIYTNTLSVTPFYDRTARWLYSLISCVFHPTHYSYKHPSHLGVSDMCLISSLYLHVLFLSVGFMYHYLWCCLYVYLLIVLYVLLWSVGFMYHHPLILFICIFIYWKSGTSDLLVLMLLVLQCTDYI